MQRPGLPELALPDQRVQRSPGHEVHRAAEQLGQVVGEVVDLPAEPGSGPRLVQQIDVAPGHLLAPRHRAEDVQRRDPVAPADLVGPSPVDRAEQLPSSGDVVQRATLLDRVAIIPYGARQGSYRRREHALILAVTVSVVAVRMRPGP